jgi:hypothetical protein
MWGVAYEIVRVSAQGGGLSKKGMQRCTIFVGEEKTKMNDCAKDGPLTKEQLLALRVRLSKMSWTAVRDFYHASWTLCKIERDEAPRAAFVQQLVQAWKELSKRPR